MKAIFLFMCVFCSDIQSLNASSHVLAYTADTKNLQSISDKRRSRRSLNALTCSDYWLLSSEAMKRNNIIALSSSINKEGKVEIRQQGRITKKGESNYRYFVHSNDNLLDWDNLKGNAYESVPGDECRMGKSILAYIKATEKGNFNDVIWRSIDTSKMLFNLKGYFLVDQYGVDQVINRLTTIDPYKLKRVYGTNTNFSVNDLTRIGNLNILSQKFGVVGSLKNSKTDEVFLDAYGGEAFINFKFDSILSQSLSARIWMGNVEVEDQKIVCLIWQGDHRKQSCKKYSNHKNRKQSYFVNDYKVAKKLFKILSKIKNDSLYRSGDSCPLGQFCDLPGGQYINAIYEGDFSKYRKTDRMYLAALLKKKNDIIAKEVKPFFDLLGFNKDKEFSLLNYFTDQYLKNYKANAQECFDSGAVEINFVKDVPGTIYVNGLGMETSRASGFSLYGTYKINEEFVEVCKNICGVDGFGPFIVGGFDAAYNKNRINRVMQGLTAMIQDYDCNSDTIKQFEENLIKFQALQNQRLYFQRNSD